MVSASLIIPLLIVAALFKSSVHILQEYERGVVFFLGRLSALRGPGLQLVFPVIQKLIKVDQRVITMDVPSQDVITRDNISIKVSAVLYFRVVDPSKALVAVENYLFATNQLSQTTLRSVCGEAELDEILSEREKLNHRIQEIIDQHTEPWGIKVSMVEIKHIDLPQDMQRAMAKQAEAERERRAKVIKAQGEFEAAAKLKEAADIMTTNPATIQLRYLETLRDISVEHNSTILFPMPLELTTIFQKLLGKIN